ncbi:lytic polysaccharide monooxygenase [Legionella cardiaca]|uniref:Lytic polysaccharide monooxygenase n=1 Tax=Legionella cardiaca TaxID=1071983 RepID=A0ABY8AX73_9GAMM|nr:lytic polysaccharide monooxygenase [Legionella cardiaca]WED44326.1 lytic polysaccharide monooxygenase [Legionella cardiaca]
MKSYIGICSLLMMLWSHVLLAHGTLEIPISRVYQCFKENPENPKSNACKAAVAAGGTQALYNWNEINQAAANDRHQDIIADGKLCAGGRDLFKGFNLARTDWMTSTIRPNENGHFIFSYIATAPHKTKYFKFFATKNNYNFSEPLKWSDLEDSPFCTITNVTLENGHYKMDCPLPARLEGKRVIYVIWQRDDSTEAFYSCSDVYVDAMSQPMSWFELQDFYNSADIAANTKVLLRLFKNETEIENHSLTVDDTNNTAALWPIALGRVVNEHSNLLRIGLLDPQTGEVSLSTGQANKIYLSDNAIQNYHVAIDFTEPNSQVDYIYPDSISSYKAGTIVMGRNNHNRYQCKPWPYSGWCSQAPAYYEPGVGLAWQDAWTLLTN